MNATRISVSLSLCLLVMLAVPLTARTIDVVDEECERAAVISASCAEAELGQ